MTYRLITFSIDDLLHSHEEIAARLNQACSDPRHPLRITGVCQTNNAICFPCEAIDVASLRYVIAPVEADTTAQLSADLHTRWRSGFTTLGIIRLDDIQLGLFAIPCDDLSPYLVS